MSNQVHYFNRILLLYVYRLPHFHLLSDEDTLNWLFRRYDLTKDDTVLIAEKWLQEGIKIYFKNIEFKKKRNNVNLSQDSEYRLKPPKVRSFKYHSSVLAGYIKCDDEIWRRISIANEDY